MNTNYSNASGYRVEHVGLRPQGNTVTVDVPSDNPFEDELAGAPVTIVTQASGGMAKADRRQKSVKVMHKGTKQGAPIRHVQAKMQRQAAGFLPGMGALEDDDANYRRFLMRKAGLGNWFGSAMRGPVMSLSGVARAMPVRAIATGGATLVKPGTRLAIATGGATLIKPNLGRRVGIMGEDDFCGDDTEIGLFGAVRKPDPRTNKRAPKAKAKVYTVTAKPTKRQGGFMPGMGELGEVSETEYQAAKLAMVGTNYDAKPAAQATINAYNAEQSAKQTAALTSALTSGATQAANIYKGEQDRRTAAAQASANKSIADAQARVANATSAADQARAQADLAKVEAKARADIAATKGGSTKWLVGGGVALAAVAVVAFILLKKKK